MRSLAEVHVRGVPVDWRAVLTPARPVDLPTYAFVRERYWAQGVPAASRRGDGNRPRTADWRYRITWVPVAGRRPAVLSGTWLVVTGSAGAGSARECVQALAGHGAEVVLAEVSAADREALAARVREAVGTQAVSGVVSLLALDEEPLAGAPVVPVGLAATVALIQALGDAGTTAPLWVLTQRAVTTGDGDPLTSPIQAQVWGLGRVAALEHPDRWGGLIDVPEVLDGVAAERLCAVLAGSGEDQVAIRDTGVLARRLVRAPRPRAGGVWAPRGSVLVTGGTGAIGGRLARWAATRRAKRVVLTSRSGPAATRIGALAAELAAAGTSVAVLAGDVAVRSEVAALIQWIGASGPGVSSVFHAAGVGGGDALADLDVAGLGVSMAAKAGGAAHLDALAVDLDAFVTFSSGAATWGSSHLGGYAAANAFLDALVEDRRARGLAGTSVAWGLWGGGGMAEGWSGAMLQRMGLREMDPDLAIGVLAQALDHGEGPITVADIDWARFAPVLTVHRPSPLIGDLPEAREALSEPAAEQGTAGGELTTRLTGLNRADQLRMLTDLVRTEAAIVLGHSSPEALAAGRAFKDLGFDSLTAVDLRNRLNAATGMSLPATLVFDYPTSAALAGFLRSRLLGDRDEVAVVTAAVSDEPIAIVGIGCRFPGGVRGPEDFWRLLAGGADVVSDLPTDRGWDMSAIYDAASAEPGQGPRGGFVYDAGEFDPGFFGISPREAMAMDPQQRLLLETSWEALERAGIDPGLLRGSPTGVFIGASWSGYGLDRQEADSDKAHLFTGMSSSVLSGRVSYTLGLEGPAVSVDTACSSSLVALHMAGQALRSGECTLALAGGAFVAATPVMFTGFDAQLGLARDGRCKAFGAAADGMGIAEGVGVLVVERLSDARRNGHRVLAVVRGSAVNQDGASNGLMAPNGPSQQRVIRAALANAKLAPRDVDAVEAHGTGTTLGDPIEAQALLATYGQDRPQDRPLWLGSVKSNIGHAQAAAGMAGVIKMVLALQHQELPRTLHADEPSPHIDWSSGEVRLLNRAVAWPIGDRPRRAGVSAFGGSGTNAHVILEEAPATEPGTGDTTDTPDDAPKVLTGGPTAWLLSARSAAGLAAQAERLGEFASAGEPPDPIDVGWSLVTTRSAFEHRAVLLGENRDELTAGLAALAAGEPAGGVIGGVIGGTVPAGGEVGRVVFVFPGQGSQWAGMGRELAENSPVFAARLAECARALSPYVDWSLDDVLAGGEGAPSLDRVDVVQPALWAIMVSLAAVWEAAGVRPDAVVGHSQGEIAAACVAGILTLEDAAKVVALRSRALTRLSGRGGMLFIGESADAVEARVAAWDGQVAIAAVNGPAATVVSGEPAVLSEVAAGCERDGVRARVLPVDYASHGPQVDTLRDEILTLLAGVAPGPARVPMVSAMTGEFLAGPEMDAEYWYASLRSSVRFRRAIEVLGAGYGVFVEVSAHPVLTAAVADTVEDAVVAGTLRRDDGGPSRLLASLAEVHVHGVAVYWAAVLPAGRRVALPTYAFQHQRYWPVSVAGAADVASAGLGSVGHPLLGAVVELADGDALVFTGRLSLTAHPWLAGHEVGGTVFFPGTGFAELAAVAGARLGCTRIDELTMATPLVLPATGDVQVQVTVSAPGGDGRRDVEIFARPVDAGVPWTRHAAGRVAPAPPPADFADGEFTVWPPAGAVAVPLDGVHQDLAAIGPAFQGLRAVWRRDGDVFAEVVLPEAIAGNAADFGLHPVLLDAALSAVWHAGPVVGGDGARMPFAWSGLSLYAVGASVLRARLRQSPAGAVSLVAADATGAPVVSVESLVLRPASASAAARSALRDALFRVEWTPVAVPAPASGGRWAVVGPDRLGLAERLGAAGVEVSAYADLAALAAAIEAGGTAPETVLAGLGTAAHIQEDADEGAAARRVTGEALELAQRWLALDLPARLVVVTRGAVATEPGEGVADLGAAAARGLLRSAQSENPGRLILIDLPGDAGAAPDPAGVLVAALDTAEPEIAVRGGGAYARRLARPSAVAAPAGATNETAPDDEANPGDESTSPRVPGAVLVTGGTGTLAGLTARHLAATGRAAHLILVSRSGPGAAGAAALAAGIAATGVGVMVAACDAGDRAALTALLAGLPAGTRLSGVVHTAGVVDDGIIGSLTPERVDAVMRPKTDAAWALHELTLGLDLDLFVLFSSVAATFGGPGQGNYAAGNAFLDALAERRRADGLTAVSLAWGAWMAGEGIGRNLSKGLLDRITRAGAGELSADEGLTLLDLALTRDEAVLMPVRFDVAGMRAQAARGAEVPALLRGLAGPVRLSTASAAGQGAGADTLRRRLAGVSPAERDRVLTDLVRTHVAAVLGHTSADAVELSRAFTDLGFDSLTAVELRNRLSAATGLRLPATLVFDYPTAGVLAGHLASELLGVLSPDATRPALTAVPIEPGEPIAIVGMGCRFPGGVRDPESLWELLSAGGDAITELPLDRGWDIAGMYHPDPDTAGTFYARSGGFVHDAAEFDPGFFGISPREALAMDPQQRLLLEISWEALERAGIDPMSLRGSQTGVFAGGSALGYGLFASTGSEGHLLTGGSTSVLSGRVSYTLGLEGPAVTVDTACSSSLVALHLAAQALRAGECSLALAGGVTIMATPGALVGFSRQRGLAQDGRCKAFSAHADGIGMAEGAGMMLLERLSDARRNGHPVLAVIRGSAVNQDGASNGLTAPNGPSQQRVIRAALANARLSAAEVDAVEAHGTGTTLGDPIEAQALLATYGQDRPEDRPLWLGSVKSNLGHTQSAAGAAGVMKMVLALRHQELPRTLHAEEPAENIDWSAGNVELLAKPRPWPVNGRVRRAGVSAFGISGTNAHVIIEEAPAAGDPPSTAGDPEPAVPVLTGPVAAWLVSARSGAGLRAQAGRLGEFVRARPELDVADVAWSLVTSRSVFEHRAVVVGRDRPELLSGLSSVAAGRPAAGVVTGTVPAGGGGGRVVFVFPGQGSQWAGMGRELAEASPVFAARLAECGRALAPYVDWSLDDVLHGREGAPGLDRVDVVQPALWAVMVSLASVWQAAGVEPDAVVGHSQGEIAAAVVAGILTLEDAAKIVALRSQALTALSGRGGMLSIAESADAVAARVAHWDGRASVAAVNGPDATVVSGDPDALAEVLAGCERDGVRARMLPVDYASHGPQADELREEILRLLDGVVPGPARVPIVSAMTGEFLRGPEMDAGYWYASLRAPVEFSRAIEALGRAGYGVFVETSAHPVLVTAIGATLENARPGDDPAEPGTARGLRRPPVLTGTLRRDDGGADRMLASLAEVHVHGVPVDWAAVLPTGARVDLPTYAFQHQRFWLETGKALRSGDPAEARFWAAVEDGDLAGLTGTLAVDPDKPFREVLPALASWRQRERGETVTAGWRYRISWPALPDPRPAPLTGTWLLVAAPAQRELAGACMSALDAAGADVVLVETAPGETGRQALADRLDPGPAPAGVVSLLALDEAPLPGAPVVTTGLAGTLALLQALGDRGIEAPLWVLTRGAVAAGPGETLASPGQSPVWGLGRVAALEHPGRWGGLIDLPSELDERAADRLVRLLAAGDTLSGEDQVAIRGDGIRVRRLVRAPRTGGAERWTPTGTVLVTGGTGAVGGRVGGWLAGRGAPRIVLSSRSGPAATGSAALAATLAEAGAAVEVVACDTAHREPAAALLDRIDRSGPALTAVFHAAGTNDVTPLGDLTVAGLAETAAAKLAGAVNLDELTSGRELTAFVTFSSGAAIWGSAGQAAYAAANAFLDGLAEHRRGRGLAATSVSWGLWGGGGMGQGESGDRLQRLGLREMDPDLAIETLAGIIDASTGSTGSAAGETATATVTVADVDWARFAPVFTLHRPSALIADLPEVRQALSAHASEPDGQDDGRVEGTLRQQLNGLSRIEQERMLTDLVRAEAAAVLGHASMDVVEADRAFKDLGFDSLTAVELRNRLNKATGMRLPATLVFDYPTPEILAGHVRSAMNPGEGTESPSIITEIERLQSALAGVTSGFEMRDDVTRLLRGLLSNWIDTHGAEEPVSTDIEFQSATPDEVFSFLDQELGPPRSTPQTN
ncbi:type I polyketide synthase [Thermocatellispora tengchongensis]|uniref:type I polyketide synthase n=1 Tax=Thermocatellispora tengchongensis TaxID=1073253 RepID=UPI0028AC68D5|nr:SDR family NAD(P)-dependent oxidoreductase [Thermocatellispora tengchongensis]